MTDEFRWCEDNHFLSGAFGFGDGRKYGSGCGSNGLWGVGNGVGDERYLPYLLVCIIIGFVGLWFVRSIIWPVKQLTGGRKQSE